MFERGYQVASYELIEPIGKGGFATVWKAKHPVHGYVALKILHPELLKKRGLDEGPTVSQRFLAEAELIKKLDYPGFVRIIETVVDEKNDFISYSMELLEGRNLAGWIRVIPLSGIFLVMSVVADTLQRLHDAQVIHRDIKASNIFLCQSSGSENRYGVKLIDFGIAKDLSQERLLESTATGYFIGTLARMPPECFLRWKSGSQAVFGPKVDQWGFGVTLFYLLSGSMPFNGDTMVQLMTEIEEGRTQPLKLQKRFELKETPPEILQFFQRCLAVEPAARFASMSEVAHETRKLADLVLTNEGGHFDGAQTELSQLGGEEPGLVTFVTEILEEEFFDLRQSALDATVDAESEDLSLNTTERRPPGSSDSHSRSQNPQKLAPPNIGKRRVLLTAAGDALPVDSNEGLKLKKEAYAKTFVKETPSPLEGSSTAPPPLGQAVLDSDFESADTLQIKGGLKAVSANDTVPLDHVDSTPKESPRISLIFIGVACGVAGFLSYLLVWWLRL